MNRDFAAILVAAGHGCIEPGTSKLVEAVDTQRNPMIVKVLKTVAEANLGQIFLVVNERFGGEVVRACWLKAASVMDLDVRIVHQQQRRGAADAVLSAVQSGGVATNFLVVYGDMPLWRPQTLRRLATQHLETGNPMTMMTVERGEGTPVSLERYGRVVRNALGKIMDVIEPGDTLDPEVLSLKTVNPSLYGFNIHWFRANVGRIPFKDRPDGYGGEQHLPPLARLLAQDGGEIHEVRLEDPTEALGVNNKKELAEAYELLRRR